MIRLAGAYESRGHITADGGRCGAVCEDLSGLPASPFLSEQVNSSLAKLVNPPLTLLGFL
jgi:hypothetical protein